MQLSRDHWRARGCWEFGESVEKSFNRPRRVPTSLSRTSPENHCSSHLTIHSQPPEICSVSKISFSRARSSWPSSSSANTFITLVLSTAKTVPDAPLPIELAVAKEKERFQASLLGGDLDALRERRKGGGPTCPLSTAQPDDCREVGLMVGMCAGEGSEHEVPNASSS
jgi:hypothetical protein